ncbi:MAG: uracil-DNA glycosylase [Candidatus Parabeggiatoa sp. nov. 3]|nr:MAG: uracil-DNA glycosylase [Gammaproteobacteria bacterium]RKZ65840.1 MAG: uracil-DNA glycosylase [Gammaproteobacteria bacterium]RKZ87304.1 MAG: uracil-DNA glycosylase [Gammaproteobacteria bacterium]HEW98567.1 uracil-DNA glycosylase [Beggiatoa sp.]
MNELIQLPPTWEDKLASEYDKPYFQKLIAFLNDELKTQTIYPPNPLILNAFECCAFEEIKVVIIGQDPYHGEGQAHGLCFSVNEGVKIPPSLKNIFKEIQSDLGKDISKSGNLERWAKQGVLLLNAILTVRAGKAASHRNKGWEQFTDTVIRLISEEKEQVVFLFWGNYAQQKGKIVDDSKHLVLKSAHPSPLSAKLFFGNQHFSQANQYLEKWGKTPIDW